MQVQFQGGRWEVQSPRNWSQIYHEMQAGIELIWCDVRRLPYWRIVVLFLNHFLMRVSTCERASYFVLGVPVNRINRHVAVTLILSIVWHSQFIMFTVKGLQPMIRALNFVPNGKPNWGFVPATWRFWTKQLQNFQYIYRWPQLAICYICNILHYLNNFPKSHHVLDSIHVFDLCSCLGRKGWFAS